MSTRSRRTSSMPPQQATASPVRRTQASNEQARGQAMMPAMLETPVLDSMLMDESLQQAASARPLGGAGGSSDPSSPSDADPGQADADIRLAPQVAAGDRLTLRGGTHSFGALMNIAESGDYGVGGLGPDTVIADDGSTLSEVYELYRSGRIGSENMRWEGHVAEELVASIRQNGFITDAATAEAAGLNDAVGSGRGEFHLLNLVPADEVQSEEGIDDRLERERGFRDFVANGHRPEDRETRVARRHREHFLEQFAHEGGGTWRRHDGQPVTVEHLARLREELPRTAEGRGLLSGAALEAYRAHVQNPSNAPIEPTAWARAELARRADRRQHLAEAAEFPQEVATPDWFADLDEEEDEDPGEGTGGGPAPAAAPATQARPTPTPPPTPSSEVDELAEAGAETPSRRLWREAAAETEAELQATDDADHDARRRRRANAHRARIGQEVEADPSASTPEEQRAAGRGTGPVTYEDGSVSVRGERTWNARRDGVDEDGNGTGAQRQGSAQGGIAFGDGIVQGEGAVGRSTVTEDGTLVNTDATGSVNLGDRQVQLGARRQTGGEGQQTATSATGRAQLNRNLDGVGGAGLRVERSAPARPGSRVRRTVHVDAGYDADISSPVGPIDDAGHYVVRGTMTWRAELGGGASGTTNAGMGIGVTASGRVGEQRAFTRRFSSEDEARRWYDEANRHLSLLTWQQFGQPRSAEEVEAMGEGESRTLATQQSATGGGSITFEGVTVGVSVTVSHELQVVVTRCEGGQVRVQFRDATGRGEGGTVGFAGASVGNTNTRTELAGAIVEYDVSGGEGSTGWSALSRVLNDREIPEGRGGDGWRVVERSTGTRRSNATQGGIGPVQATSEVHLQDEHVIDDEGNEFDRHSGGMGRTATMGLPESWTEGTALGDSSEAYEFETDTDEGGARLTADLNGANAYDTHRRLAAAAGVETHLPGVDGASSGTWHLASELTESQLRTFCARVQRNQWNPGLVGAAWVHHAERLQERVRAAGRDMDAARVAVRDYMAVTGDRGMSQIRQVIGNEPMQMDVTLADSNVWTGEGGRARVRRQIEQLRTQMGEDPSAARDAIERAYEDQRQRLDAMRDQDQYEDLPPALRQQEIRANEPLLGELGELRTQVRQAIQARANAEASGAEPQAEHDPSAEGESGPESGTEREASQSSSQVEDPESRRLRASLRGDVARMQAAYQLALAAYQAVGRERRLHDGEQRPRDAVYVANEGSSGSWNPFAGPTRYERVQAHWQTGRRRWTEGDRLKRQWDHDRVDVPTVGRVEPDAINAVRRLTWQAHDAFESAHEAFIAQARLYVAIRSSFAERGQTVAYFGHTSFEVPD